MNEITGLFGPGRSLVGTLSLPTIRAVQPVGFILLNAGVIHRIGPHRINVKLARALVGNGFASLRFDLSGQGDSLSIVDAAPIREQAVADVRGAMDHMERTVGIRQFAVAGLCSGAHHAVSTGLADARIVGIWMYDSFIYPTAKTRRVASLRRLRNAGIPGLVRWMSRRVRVALRHPREPPRTDVQMGGEYWQATPSRDEYGRALQQLVERGVDISTMFSGSFLDDYNYAGQFRDAFRDFAMADVVRCSFRPELDHTITSIHAQGEVIGAVCRWAEIFHAGTGAPAVGATASVVR